jgi:hypothetical protein
VFVVADYYYYYYDDDDGDNDDDDDVTMSALRQKRCVKITGVHITVCFNLMLYIFLAVSNVQISLLRTA